MKKILSTFFIFLFVFSGINISFAEDLNISTSSTWLTSTWKISEIVNNVNLTNTGSEVSNISYIYYYGQWCSHCANLDKYLKNVWAYEKLNIEKKEVYFDDANRDSMMSDGKRLWLSDSDIWVPFLIVNDSWIETPIIWDGPIIEKLKPILWEVPENKNKTIVLTILVILAIIIPIFLIKLSNKN